MWVIFEIAIVIVGLVLSIITLYLKKNKAYNIMVVVSFILTAIDLLFTLKKSCSEISKAPDPERGEQGDPPENSCIKLDVLRLILSEVVFYPILICDIFEIVVGKDFEKTDTTSDRLSISLLARSLLYMFLTVYVARILILS